ncbi:MAG: class I adenylate-forming enzyme family protein [Rhodospirillales bacterium]
MSLEVSNQSSSENVGHKIAVAAARASGNPFLVDDDQTLSGEKFLYLAAARATQIQQMYGTNAAVIAISCGRGIITWVDAVGVWLAGGTVVLLGISLPEEHVRAILEIAAPDAVIGAHPRFPETTAHFPLLGEAVTPALSGISFPAPVLPAAIVFTSGSTNQPKGAVLSHRALKGNADATEKVLGLGTQDRLFFAIPFNFISAISHFLVTLQSGALLHCVETRLMFRDFIDGLAASGANAVGGSPLQLRWIADADRTQTIDWAMSSGDHLAVQTINRLLLQNPSLRLFTVYGMTELAGRFCTLPPAQHSTDAGSVGCPIDGLTATVRNEDGDECITGESGEIYVTGNYLMEGYHNDPEASARTLTFNGLRTGDMGIQQANGLLIIEGRSDDVFKCNGEKVNALHIVTVMMQSGLFMDLAVTAWDDPVYGTVPIACYSLKYGEKFNRGAIMRHLRATLPPSHIPRRFLELKDLPRTGSGKLRRRVLNAIVKEKLGSD